MAINGLTVYNATVSADMRPLPDRKAGCDRPVIFIESHVGISRIGDIHLELDEARKLQADLAKAIAAAEEFEARAQPVPA